MIDNSINASVITTNNIFLWPNHSRISKPRRSNWEIKEIGKVLESSSLLRRLSRHAWLQCTCIFLYACMHEWRARHSCMSNAAFSFGMWLSWISTFVQEVLWSLPIFLRSSSHYWIGPRSVEESDYLECQTSLVRWWRHCPFSTGLEVMGWTSAAWRALPDKINATSQVSPRQIPWRPPEPAVNNTLQLLPCLPRYGSHACLFLFFPGKLTPSFPLSDLESFLTLSLCNKIIKDTLGAQHHCVTFSTNGKLNGHRIFEVCMLAISLKQRSSNLQLDLIIFIYRRKNGPERCSIPFCYSENSQLTDWYIPSWILHMKSSHATRLRNVLDLIFHPQNQSPISTILISKEREKWSQNVSFLLHFHSKIPPIINLPSYFSDSHFNSNSNSKDLIWFDLI